ncbi:MAG: FemAB family protein [Burkholderiales bacterium]|nr:FemAB family protein [Burkholderiales bacterium]
MRLSDYGLGDVTGSGVELFQIEGSDLPESYLAWLRNRTVNKFLEVRFQDHTMVSLAEFVAACNESRSTLLLGIRRRDEGRYIGNIKLAWDPHHGTGDVGFVIGDRASWRRGFAREAVALMCGIGFERIGLRKIIAGSYEGNEGSIRALEHSGFKPEARLVEHVLFDGRAVDVCLMRLFRREFIDPSDDAGPLVAALNADRAKSALANALAASGLDATTRQEDRPGWSAAWNAMAYQAVAYAVPMIDYQHAYFRGAGWTLVEASVVLRNDGRPCGIWPLTLGGPPGAPQLTSAGAAVLAPVFVPSLPARTIKRLCTQAIAFVRALCAELDLPRPKLEQAAFPGGAEGLSEWQQQLLAAGATQTLRHDLFIDLRPPLAEIRAGFRKSYRPLINAGLRSWETFVIDGSNADPGVWEEFRALHRDVAGRVTRGAETWQSQFEMLAGGHAFLVGLRDPAQRRLVGASFFQCTRDEGLYAVAAYDRSLFDKPLGHVAQQVAIEAMKARGLRWYRVGERQYPQDEPPPTDKQVSISEFKQGFASHLFGRSEFVLPLAPRATGTAPP